MLCLYHCVMAKLRPATRVIFVLLLMTILAACQPTPTTHNEPDNLPPDLYSLIQERRTEGDLQQAIYFVERHAATDGWTPELHRLIGTLWQDVGDYTQALPHLSLAAETSDDIDLLRQVTELFLQTSDFAAARDLLDKLLSITPDDAWTHYHQGLLLAATDPLRAEPHLRQVARHDSYGHVARALLGIVTRDYAAPALSSSIAGVLAENELWLYAEQAFLFAATWNYPFPEALAYAGLMRDIQGKNGRIYIDQALALDPINIDGLLVLGIHLRTHGDLEDSVIALQYALALAPESPVIYAELGESFQQLGLFDRAQAALQRAVALSENDAVIQDALAQFYSEEAYHLPEQFIEDLARQSEENPDDPATLARYAWALHLQGESESASQYLEKALALDPDDPDVRFSKARILLDNGLTDAAILLLEDLSEGSSGYASTAQAILDNLR